MTVDDRIEALAGPQREGESPEEFQGRQEERQRLVWKRMVRIPGVEHLRRQIHAAVDAARPRG